MFASRSERVDPNQTSLFDQDTGVFTEPEQTGEKSNTSTTHVQQKKTKKTREEKIDSKFLLESQSLNQPMSSVLRNTQIYRPYQLERSSLERNYASFLQECIDITFILVHINVPNAKRNGRYLDCSNPITPPALIPHSLASSSLVGEFLYRKFVLDVPLYRQLPEMNRLGYHASETTLTNWVIKTAQLIEPLYEELHRHLCQVHHLQGDEPLLRP